MSLDWLTRWLFIGLLALIDAAWMASRGIGLDFNSIIHRIAFAAILFAVSFSLTFISSKRPPTSRIRFVLAACIDIFLTLIQMVLFLPAAAAFSYVVATLDRPLVDAVLLHADTMIGFDWASLFAWTHAHASVAAVLSWTYFSVFWQAALIIFLGSTQRPGDTNGDLMWTLLVSAAACSLISGFLPALGHGGLAGPEPVAALLDVRNGVWHVMNFDKVQGIVTFPSFHTALGILLPYAIRRVRWAFWLLLPLDAVMIISTPAVGGHYLVDTIAGCVLAALTIWATRRIRQGIERIDIARARRTDGAAAIGSAGPSAKD
jgi:hypothetical protein